jgi:hypothetical protein
MPHANVQTPRLVHLIGEGHGAEVPFSTGRRGERSNVNLRVETDSFATDSPLIFADSNPFAGTCCCEPVDYPLCHKSVLHSVSWHQGWQSIIDILYARLFFGFSDVVYIFADDFSSLRDILLRLFSWIDIGSASKLSVPNWLLLQPKLITYN